ncbi:MAG: FixH family protein [Alphaproteobacteria bacterium]|nr:FixH family protein [Alphaproteobacteria bacterium]
MTTTKRKDGWWYPWIFVAMFGVVAAANGALIWFARASFSGLSSEGAYDKGLNYNRALEGAARQEKLGWRAKVAFMPVSSGASVIEARFEDKDGRPLEGLEAEALIRRPAEAGLDQRLALVPQGGGVFRAEIALPKPGQWIVRVHAFRDRDVFQTETRIVAPKPPPNPPP